MSTPQQTSNLVVVKCPQCGLRLSFKAVPNYREKPITCPKCHHSDIVGKFTLVHDPSVAATQNSPEDNDDTRTLGNVSATIRCLDTGESFALKPGANTIGRSANSPKATILFTDREQYMSRLHATVTLVVTNNIPQLQLRDENSANGTFLKGIRIPEKSIVKLNPGDEFKMGKLSFICSITGADRHSYGYDNDDTTM